MSLFWNGWKMPKLYLRTRKGTIQSQGSPFKHIQSVQGYFRPSKRLYLRKVSSWKLYYSELSFQSNLNHSIWMSVDKIMSKIRKLLKAEKLWLFEEIARLTTREWLTTRDSKQCWRLVSSLTTREWPKLDSLDSKASILHPSKSKTCSKHHLRLKIYMNCINNKINYL